MSSVSDKEGQKTVTVLPILSSKRPWVLTTSGGSVETRRRDTVSVCTESYRCTLLGVSPVPLCSDPGLLLLLRKVRDFDFRFWTLEGFQVVRRTSFFWFPFLSSNVVLHSGPNRRS